MDNMIVDTIRKLTRSVLTLMLVGTLCYCAVRFAHGLENALEAAAFIAGPSGFVLEKWFESRRREREADK